MKITKRQLRRIIREEKARLMEYGSRPYDPTVPGDWEHQEDKMMAYPTEDATAKKMITHYEKWVKEYGHVTPASSSVMATYFVSRDRDDPVTQGWNHRTLADEFGIDHDDLGRELKRQRKEYDAGGVLSDEEIHKRSFKEGKIKITKRQLRRIIKEEKRKILREQSWVMSDDRDPLDDPGTQMISRPGKGKQNYFPDTDARLEGPEISQSAIEEMEYVIEMFAEDGYSAEAKGLEAVLNMAIKDMPAGKPSQKLTKVYQNLSDMAREQIPYEIGGWIRGEV